MGTSTDKHSILALETPLGEGVLELRGFSGQEQLSRLFHFRLDLVSDNPSIKARELVGQCVSFSVELDDGLHRKFHGVVNRLVAGKGDERDRRRYQADVVPQMWLLTCTQNSRIFQDLSVPEIIAKVFDEHQLSDYEVSGIHEEHPTRDYCVQYRESDYNFVMRLMEEEGIFFTFRHESNKHTIVMADQAGAYEECEESQIDFNEGTQIAGNIASWERRYSFVPGAWAQTDYHFQQPADGVATPAMILMSEVDTLVDLPAAADFEVYDFPGLYDDHDVGRKKTQVRMQEEEVAFDVAKGSGTCVSFRPLGTFNLSGHESDEENGSFVITQVQHVAVEPRRDTSIGGAMEAYSNAFTCIPDSVVFRPPRLTPKPLIQGSQTAVVTGPPDQEIFTDEHGRVKVQFFWDREGRREENTSCWIRCSQTSAGKGWGSMMIPRIGQEVVVTFLEGDPDRPLITGVVYNAEQIPAYSLPDERTKSYIKTNSSQGGDGYNEVRFEDKTDEEQIFIHAQRNLDERVRGSSMENVGGSRHLTVGHEDKGDYRAKVHGDRHLQLIGNHIEKIDGNVRQTIGGDQNFVVKGDKRDYVHGDDYSAVDGGRFNMVGADWMSQVGHLVQTRCGWMEVAASQSVDLSVGTSALVFLDASQILLWKSPTSFIRVDDSGVTIQGPMVHLNPGAVQQPPGPHGAQPPFHLAGEASPEDPVAADNSVTGNKSSPDSLA